MAQSARTDSFSHKFVLHLPRQIDPGVLYIQRNDQGAPLFAHFLCPCGCGHEMSVPLQGPNSYPPAKKWHLAYDADDKPGISPSIEMVEGCRSHYFIRSAKVEWC